MKATTSGRVAKERDMQQEQAKASYVASLSGTCPDRAKAAVAISQSWWHTNRCDSPVIDKASRHVSTRMHVSVYARVAR